MNLWAVGVAGAVGCVLGSLVAYWVGMYGGRPLIEKYGRYVLVSPHDLDMADRWFAKRGEIIVLRQSSLAGHSHLYRVSGRRCSHEFEALHRLHFCRVVAMVFGACLHRPETGRAVEQE